MTLDEQQCWARLGGGGHGVLGTVHPTRGVDAVPVVFVVVGRSIVIPIDAVKPKRSTHLQRVANLDQDDRAVLLVDHYQGDWSRLWWVRVHGRAASSAPGREVLACLASHFPAYRAPGSVVAIITLGPTEVRGWSAAE